MRTTHELTELPKGKRALRNKWVFKLKPGDVGNPPRYKACIVVKGFHQKQGADFDEIFVPIVKMTSTRTVLSIATSMDLEVELLDVKTEFLHGDLEEEIYIHQLEGFIKKGKENLVCRLKKSLYGLKQAPPAMVPEIRLLHDQSRILQDVSGPLRVCEEVRRR